jgi:hypothetical protein
MISAILVAMVAAMLLQKWKLLLMQEEMGSVWQEMSNECADLAANDR